MNDRRRVHQRDPRLLLQEKVAALAVVMASAKFRDNPEWRDLLLQLDFLRQRHLEAMLHVHELDLERERAFVRVLDQFRMYGVYDPREVERLKAEIEGLRKQAAEMEDAMLFDKDSKPQPENEPQ